MKLAGKTAIITGGARGIGGATARRFVAEGARVAIASRRQGEGRALVDELSSGHAGRASFVELDITDEDAWRNAVATVVQAFGGLNVLVNNAGIIRVAPVEKTDLELFRKVLDTNLTGAFLGIRTVIAEAGAQVFVTGRDCRRRNGGVLPDVGGCGHGEPGNSDGAGRRERRARCTCGLPAQRRGLLSLGPVFCRRRRRDGALREERK